MMAYSRTIPSLIFRCHYEPTPPPMGARRSCQPKRAQLSARPQAKDPSCL